MHIKSLASHIHSRSFVLFWMALSLTYAVVFIGAEFAGSPVSGMRGFAALAAQWVVVSGSAAALLGLLALNRFVFAVMSPLLFTLSAIAAYYKLSMGLSLTPTIVDLALTNNLDTWATVMSPLLFLAAFAGLAAGGAAAWWRFRHVDSPRPWWGWMAAFIMILAVPLHFSMRLKAPVVARVPFSFWYSVSDCLANRKAVEELRDNFSGVTATVPSDAPDVVVVVIGESLRPDHLQINGYGRNTTPHLASDTAVISFPAMTTEPCYTHLSVPHIMTRADSAAPDRAFTEQSFITLFKRAGYRTAWLSNQDAVDTYAYFMHEADTLVQCNGARSLYGYDKWLDTDLLPAFDATAIGEGAKRLTVLHTIGSHWWYPSHCPDSLERFKPVVDSRILSELSHEQMVNSYDNTILATDSFIKQLIDRLRKRNAVLIFISDHGEALGEEGNYLHAADYPQLHPTACFVWYSAEYRRRNPGKVEALRKNAAKQWSTDAIFHSVLDAASVSTPVANPSMSLFTCGQ